MNEFEFIAKLMAPLAASQPGALGLADDAAIVSVPPGQELVITKDAVVAGVHFIGDEDADVIAQKALRVNLSDLAAMGAAPYVYFLALMLPSDSDESWLHGFAGGLRADQSEFGITLMGGDTTRSAGVLALSVTALGLVSAGKALTRKGAKAGEDIYVSGTIGDAALGLLMVRGAELEEDAKRTLMDRYRLPQPRVTLGPMLVGIATSCIDVSDGLVQDLGHICKASGVGADIECEAVPLSPAAIAALSALQHPRSFVLSAGDDYELLFTAPVSEAANVAAAAQKAGVNVTRIGRIREGRDVQVLDAAGKTISLSYKGYSHF